MVKFKTHVGTVAALTLDYVRMAKRSPFARIVGVLVYASIIGESITVRNVVVLLFARYISFYYH